MCAAAAAAAAIVGISARGRWLRAVSNVGRCDTMSRRLLGVQASREKGGEGSEDVMPHRPLNPCLNASLRGCVSASTHLSTGGGRRARLKGVAQRGRQHSMHGSGWEGLGLGLGGMLCCAACCVLESANSGLVEADVGKRGRRAKGRASPKRGKKGDTRRLTFLSRQGLFASSSSQVPPSRHGVQKRG